MLTTLFFISAGMVFFGFIVSELGQHGHRSYEYGEGSFPKRFGFADWTMMIGLILFVGCVVMLMVTAPAAVHCR